MHHSILQQKGSYDNASVASFVFHPVTIDCLTKIPLQHILEHDIVTYERQIEPILDYYFRTLHSVSMNPVL